MQTRQKVLLQSIITVFSLLCLLSFFPVSAQASKATGYSSHFASRRITYRIRSTSKTYRNSWTKAVKAWNKLHVISLVPAPTGTQPQISMSTKAKYGEYYGYPEYFADNYDVSAGMNLYLSRYYVWEWILKSRDRVSLCSNLIGSALGLKDSKSANSIMNPGPYMPTAPTKTDKKGLQNAYRGVPWN